MNENIGVIFLFWISFIVLILVMELKPKWKFLGILICWIGLGMSLAIMYPDEFADMIIG